MIERIPFGRTGHRSSRVIFGAAAIGAVDQETADSLLPLLDAHGVNHLDVARSYGDAELRLAPWLRTRRDDFFLATKTGERTADGARRELEESLSRLGVDSGTSSSCTTWWSRTSGRPRTARAARSRPWWRPGRGPGQGDRCDRARPAHREHAPGSLERFDFDSVLLPYNFSLLQLDDYRRDLEQLLAVCETRAVAVQTIKSIARRRWSDPSAESGRSWYEPIRESGALQRGVRWVLGRPGLFVNSSSTTAVADVSTRRGRRARARRRALAADQADQDIQPLFDGTELEASAAPGPVRPGRPPARTRAAARARTWAGCRTARGRRGTGSRHRRRRRQRRSPAADAVRRGGRRCRRAARRRPASAAPVSGRTASAGFAVRGTAGG